MTNSAHDDDFELRVAFEARLDDGLFLSLAISRADAIAEIAAAAGVSCDEVHVVRARHADDLLRPGAATALRLLQRGYVVPCSRCGRRVRPQGECLVDAQEVFCSPACREASTKGEEDGVSLSEAIAQVEEHWPEAEVVGAATKGADVEVHFTFGAGRHAFWLSGSGHLLVAPTDRDEWIIFDAAMRDLRETGGA